MENEEKKIDNKIDTSWYSTTKLEFHIKTPEQLVGLSYLVNNGNTFLNKIIYLDSNINLEGIEWTPIGYTDDKYFSGFFNGNGYNIENLALQLNKNYYQGLFGNIIQGAVENLKIINARNSEIDNISDKCLGVLAATVKDSFIINTSTEGEIIIKSSNIQFIGGIIGKCSGKTKIVGCYSKVIIGACFNKMLITPSLLAIGGIVGLWEKSEEKDDHIISNCFFDGKITCSESYYVSGILGLKADAYDNILKIDNCLVQTTNISCIKKEIPKLFSWITTSMGCEVTNCYWPILKYEQDQPNAVNNLDKNFFG
ncbi:MAG: hypothetical protein HUJ68_10560, partial [Clostridia bacterium]|nr:hypothetical protein [Clostridia bacterium]